MSEENTPSREPDNGSGLSPQRRRRRIVYFSLIPFVLLPVVLAAAYFLFLASDRYASEIKFTIRAPAAQQSADIFGAFTGMTGSGSTKTDSYIIVDFLSSRELVEELEKKIDLRSIYGRNTIDWFSRFDATDSREKLAEYLQWRISVFFDISSQIVSLEVQAFSPEDAKLVANQILEISEKLVNDLSNQAREDSLRAARNEVTRAETQLREQRRRISRFREVEQDVDPTKTVEAQQLILGQIEGELGTARARQRSMLRFMAADAPSMKVLESRIRALEAQVEQERAKLGLGQSGEGNGSETLTSRVGAYEELAVDLEFLQQAYVVALSSLERARVEADRQQRYIAVFVQPRLAEQPSYPLRLLSVFLVTVFSFIFWGIGVIAVYIVREHLT